MVKFSPTFCYCAVDQKKAALVGPEMVKFGPNFCYCAVHQEKAAFQWTRAVSSPSALLRFKMVKFGSNFCYCAKIQFNRHCVSERAAPSRERPTPSWPSRSLSFKMPHQAAPRNPYISANTETSKEAPLARGVWGVETLNPN